MAEGVHVAEGLVLDTTIVIDFRRNHPSASPIVFGLLGKRAAYIHPVCSAELLDGVQNGIDLRGTLAFLASFRRLVVKPADFDLCLLLTAQLRLAHGIGWADCLIAATCLRVRIPLVTLNDKHFKAVRGLKVIRPY